MAKWLASCQKFTMNTQHSTGAVSSAHQRPATSGTAPSATKAAPSAAMLAQRSGGALVATRSPTPRRAASASK